MLNRKRNRWLVALVPALFLTTAPASAVAECAPVAGGGEWRSMNRDLANSRHQNDETTIGPQNVAEVTASWTFAIPVGGGSIDSTPAVADGCIYVATWGRSLFALNADTGELVWRVRLKGAIGGSPAVQGGRIFLHVDSQPRTTVALDQKTGSVLWESAWDDQAGTSFFSSPVAFDGMVLSTISGVAAEDPLLGDARMFVRGSYALLDAASGAVLVRGFTIPDEDFADGHSGAAFWATPAVDVETGYAYEGTGNPFSWKQHPNSNAIIKIDVARARDGSGAPVASSAVTNPAFGKIVGSWRGTSELYVDDGAENPACEAFVSGLTCELLDVDFGASPQIFEDAAGRKLVGDHQKSGEYHVLDATTMNRVWSAVVGAPWSLGGAATASYDGRDIFVAGSFGQLVALDSESGEPQWVDPVIDTQTEGIAGTQHSQSVTTANGVVYMMDGRGILHGIDAATGHPLILRPLVLDTGIQSASNGAGVVVAQNTIFAPSGRTLVAYHLVDGG